MTGDVTDLLARQRRLMSSRRPWESHWQELGELFLPRRADFTRKSAPGQKRTESQFDGVPVQAARGLAASLDGLLKPKTQRWFSLRATDPEINEVEEVGLWLQEVEDRMYTAIYDPDARFLQRSNEVDLDLVVFGTGVLFIGERVGTGRLSFRSHHLRDVCVAENADGDIDTIFRQFTLSARQAAQRWGEESLGKATREALRENKPDEPFDFLHVVTPRKDRDRTKRNRINLPFMSVFIDVKSEHRITEGGFHEFPYVVPRWDTATDEIYGRSPAMVALPDAHTLNQIGKTLLRAGHKVVDPPLLAPDDGVQSVPRTWPGGITYYDADLLARTGGRPPLFPLNTGANLPVGREMQNDVREQVWGAFFRNVLQLPVAGPQMTATEIIERRAEFMRVIGPTFGRLEADYTGPMVERVFNVMKRAGMLPAPPDILAATSGVRFEYASPITKAQQQIEAASLQKTVQDLQAVISSDPTALQNFDSDRIVRDVAEANGLPRRWLKPTDQVAAVRDGQAQAAEAESQTQGLERLVEGTSKAAGIPGVSQLIERAVPAIAEGGEVLP